MKCNLEGLFRNVAADVRGDRRDYYAVCLEEVLDHLRQVVAGEHTIAEFAEHYCLSPTAGSTKKDEG